MNTNENKKIVKDFLSQVSNAPESKPSLDRYENLKTLLDLQITTRGAASLPFLLGLNREALIYFEVNHGIRQKVMIEGILEIMKEEGVIENENEGTAATAKWQKVLRAMNFDVDISRYMLMHQNEIVSLFSENNVLRFRNIATSTEETLRMIQSVSGRKSDEIMVSQMASLILNNVLLMTEDANDLSNPIYRLRPVAIQDDHGHMFDSDYVIDGKEISQYFPAVLSVGEFKDLIVKEIEVLQINSMIGVDQLEIVGRNLFKDMDIMLLESNKHHYQDGRNMFNKMIDYLKQKGVITVDAHGYIKLADIEITSMTIQEAKRDQNPAFHLKQVAGNTPPTVSAAVFQKALEIIAVQFVGEQIKEFDKNSGICPTHPPEYGSMLQRVRGMIFDHGFEFRLSDSKPGDFDIPTNVCKVQLVKVLYPMEADVIAAAFQLFYNAGH